MSGGGGKPKAKAKSKSAAAKKPAKYSCPVSAAATLRKSTLKNFNNASSAIKAATKLATSVLEEGETMHGGKTEALGDNLYKETYNRAMIVALMQFITFLAII